MAGASQPTYPVLGGTSVNVSAPTYTATGYNAGHSEMLSSSLRMAPSYTVGAHATSVLPMAPSYTVTSQPKVFESQVVEFTAPIIEPVPVPTPIFVQEQYMQEQQFIQEPQRYLQESQIFVQEQQQQTVAVPVEVTRTVEVPRPYPVQVPVYVPGPAQQAARTEVHIVDDRRPRNADLEELIEQLRSQLYSAETTEAILRQQIEEFHIRSREWIKKESEMESLQIEIKNLRNQIFEFQMKLVATEGQRENADGELNTLQVRLRETEERAVRVQVLTVEITSLKNQLNEALFRVQTLDSEKGMLQQQVISFEAQLTEALDNLRKVRSSFDLERSQLQDQLFGLQQHLSGAELDRDSKKNEIGFFEAKLREANEERIAANQRTTQLQITFDGECSKLRNDLYTVERERDDARRQLNILEIRIRESDGQTANVNQRAMLAERERDEALSEVRMLQMRLQDVTSQLDNANQRTNQASSGFDVERKQLQEQLHTIQLQITVYESDLDSARREISSYEIRLNEAHTQLNYANQRIASVEQERDAARGELSAYEVRLREAQEQIFVLNQQITQIQIEFQTERVQFQEQISNFTLQITVIERERDDARKELAFFEARLRETEERLAAAMKRIAELEAYIASLEFEINNLRTRLQTKTELHSQTNVKETYKVKTFEMAAKLAIMDGTDDGMFNGLPIEIEGEGLYKELVAAGRRPKTTATNNSSVTTTSQTYKVQSFEVAERLAKMGGSNDGMYNGLPIEVVGEGLYSDLIKSGRFASSASVTASRVTSGATGAAGGTTTTTTGETYLVETVEIAESLCKMGGGSDCTYKGLAIEVKGKGLYRNIRGSAGASASSGYRTVSGAASGASSAVTTSGGQTYIVNTVEIAESLLKMSGSTDFTYKGLPIEVKGRGLYRDIRGSR